MLELNKIYNMDCLEGMKNIENESIDLIVTDPPYKIISGGCRIKKKDNDCSGIFNRGISNKRTDWVDDVRTGKMFKENSIKFIDWLPECYRVLKQETHIYVMCNDRNMQELLNAISDSGFKLVNILVWKKNNCTPNKFYMKNCEFIVLARKGGQRWINNMGTKQMLEISNVRSKQHPTEKPVELNDVFILNSSKSNEVVLDPFMGVGSFALSCLKNNRNYIGFELDKKYYDIAKERIEKFKGDDCFAKV